MRLLLLLHLVAIITSAKEKKRKRPRGPTRLEKAVHIEPDPNMFDNTLPIDFLNMGVEGVFDPSSGKKQPFDGIAMYLVHDSKTKEDVRSLLKNIGSFREPRLPSSNKEPAKQKSGDIDEREVPNMFDFGTLHAVNLAKPSIYRHKIAQNEQMFRKSSMENDTKPEGSKAPEAIVPLSMFDVKTGVNEDVVKWTTCDDFAKKARFHPRDVAGVDWVPFYLWSMQTYPIPEEFKFSYPTRKVVQEYKDQYSSKLTKKIDWSAPMLLLRNWLEMLLVAGDRRGLFYGIPKSAIPEDIKNSTTWYPHATIRMKMVDQYLAIMFCEEHLALMLAVVGEEPEPSECAAEAAKLGFHGVGAPVTKQQAQPPREA